MKRQPLIVVMGNVDHGKTSLLDKIRGTAIVKAEPGQITQMISSSLVSLDLIKKICGNLLENKKINIPGLLFIDTPGHAAFNNLRKRGGNLADIAILVIDINEGIKPQTKECIDILKTYKTPFIIALNKIDLIPGWKQFEDSISKEIEKQHEKTKKDFEIKLYKIIQDLFNLNFNADYFEKISDYTKHIPIIPCSAKTNSGIKELLAILIGLAQKYLDLETKESEFGKGTILEVKKEKGFGIMLDIILYDGSISINDTIIIGGISTPVESKVKGLFIPTRRGLNPTNHISAAAGIKLMLADTENIFPGMPLVALKKTNKSDTEKIKQDLQKEVEEVIIETEEDGIVIKADSLGSLEALIILLNNEGYKIKKATIGNITKKDIIDANASKDPLNKVVIGFNVQLESSLQEKDILNTKVITDNIIYSLIEKLKYWVEQEKKNIEKQAFENLIRPAKIQILKGCIFRQSNPCVIGIEVLAGLLKVNVELIKIDGTNISSIKSMQHENENIKEAEKGKQVAISLPDVIAGRQIKEGDILFVDMDEQNFKELKKHKKYLTSHEIETLKELIEIKRKRNPIWGV